MSKSKNVTFAFSIMVLFAVACLFFLSSNPFFQLGGDYSHYIGTARSIVEGKGYFFNGRPETLYPPGTSLFIAAIIWLFGNKEVYLTRSIAILSALSLFLCLLYYRLRDERLGLLFCLIIASSPVFFSYSTQFVSSDIPYLFCSIGFLVTYEWVTKSKERYSLIGILTIFLCFILATIIRSVGVAIIAAVGVTIAQQIIFRGPSQQLPKARLSLLLAIFLVGVSVTFLWFWWSGANRVIFYKGDFRESYISQFLLSNPHFPDAGPADIWGILVRLIGNLPVLGAHLAEAFTNLPWVKPLWFSPIIVLVTFLMGVGWMEELRRDNQFAAWYALCYFGILLLWPYDENRRFVIVIVPIVLPFIAAGIRTVFRVLSESDPNRILRFGLVVSIVGIFGSIAQPVIAKDFSAQDKAAILIWICIGVGSSLVPSLWRKFGPVRILHYGFGSLAVLYLVALFSLGIRGSAPILHDSFIAPRVGPQLAVFGEAFEWIKGNTAPDAIIMAERYADVHFSTGRPTVPLPITGQQTILANTVQRYKPQYLMIVEDTSNYRYYLPDQSERLRILERAFPESPDLLYDRGNIRIFRFRGL